MAKIKRQSHPPVIIKASQLGTNCWSAERFTGGECPKLDACKYPEKKSCKAYQAHAHLVTIQDVHYADGHQDEFDGIGVS